MKNKHSSTDPSDKDYERLGRMLISIYETGYMSHKKLYKMSFIKGLVTGLGTVIGATIIVGLLLWFLSFFENVPLVGRITENVRHTVQQSAP